MVGCTFVGLFLSAQYANADGLSRLSLAVTPEETLAVETSIFKFMTPY